MAALTFTIEPDEFLGLSALVDLDRASNGGNAGSAPMPTWSARRGR